MVSVSCNVVGRWYTVPQMGFFISKEVLCKSEIASIWRHKNGLTLALQWDWVLPKWMRGSKGIHLVRWYWWNITRTKRNWMRYWNDSHCAASSSATKLMIMISGIDLRDLNSWSDEQLYYGDIAHVVITLESKRDPTQVEHTYSYN